MGPGGALEALVEARDKGLARFLGVTGHGLKAPAMHVRSLERFDFDAVMAPCNYLLMQKSKYAADLRALAALCRKHDVALQTIKSVARRRWAGRDKTYNTYFYEPLESQATIDRAVHWALGHPDLFVITAGDLQILPKMLDAAQRFEAQPADAEMDADTEAFDIQPVFA
jgi:hypothetical protein